MSDDEWATLITQRDDAVADANNAVWQMAKMNKETRELRAERDAARRDLEVVRVLADAAQGQRDAARAAIEELRAMQLRAVEERDAAIARAERAEREREFAVLAAQHAIERAERAERLLADLVEGCARWEEREQVSLHDVPNIDAARAHVEAMRARVKP